MKKLHLLFGVLIFIGCLQAHAKKSRVAMEKWQTGNVDGSTTVRRSPMRIPINVYYDDELRHADVQESDAFLTLTPINGTKSASRKIQITDEMISNSNGYVKVD